MQDALARAMQVWPFTGVPKNPSAWLLQTARNRGFDLLRRRRLFTRKQPALTELLEDCAQNALGAPPPQFEGEIADSQLRMMFVCCHPGLPPESQVALVLKTLCGFGEREIAAAFLASPAAVTKRLVRARQFLRDGRVPVELPAAAELAPRAEVVRQALYLLFNEGYKASHGDSLLREDLCAEAIRLGELLASHPAGDRPEMRALLALMHFNAARLPARTAADGALLLLAEQNRALWNRPLIQRGLSHLAASAAGAQVTRYHLEAGIACCHCLAPSYAGTNWPHILELYDSLLALDNSPIVALNRAVAFAQVRGPAAALAALDEIPDTGALRQYYLFNAVRGQLLLDSQQPADATLEFRRALALVTTPAEREFLTRRLTEAAREAAREKA